MQNSNVIAAAVGTWGKVYLTYTTTSYRRPQGSTAEMCWTDFINRIEHPKIINLRPQGTEESDKDYKKRVTAAKDSAGGYIPGKLKDSYRNENNVIYRWMLTIDIDDGAQETWDSLQNITGHAAAAHTTFSNGLKGDPDKIRFRILIPLERPVTPKEYQIVMAGIVNDLGVKNLYDDKCLKAEQFMYNPSVSTLNQDKYMCWYNDAKTFLDPDKYLMTAPTQETIPTDATAAEFPVTQNTPIQEMAQRAADASSNTTDTEKSAETAAFKLNDIERHNVYDALDHLDAGLLNYDEWIRVAFALHNCNFDFDVFDNWSKRDKIKYRGYDYTLKMWKSCETSSGKKTFKQGYIFNLAAEKCGWEPTVIKNDVELKTKIIKSTGERRIIQDAENMVRVFTQDALLKGHIKYDKFGHFPVAVGALPWKDAEKAKATDVRRWTDQDDEHLKYRLNKVYKIKPQKDFYKTAFTVVACDHGFNPLIDMLESLPKWDDDETHIRALYCDYLGAENTEYVQDVMTIWMCAAIARAYIPGIKFDYVPVLIGEQGLGKSAFIERLPMNDDFFLGTLPALDRGKEVYEQMQGKWIIDIAELSGIKRAREVETVKSFITQRSDTYRTPFDRYPEKHARTCVFIGDTNDTTFLTDLTGNRRFLPLDLQKHRITKSQWKDPKQTMNEIKMAWSQALALFHMYDSENELYKVLTLLPKVEEEARKQQELHREEDPWIIMVNDYLNDPDKKITQVNTRELWEHALRKDLKDAKPKDLNHLAKIMNNCIDGWEKGKKARGGKGGSPVATWYKTE